MGNTRKYCPYYGKNDYLYGDYYSDRFSWYRLVVHQCDSVARAKENKTCVTPEESEIYMSKRLLSADLVTLKPSMKNYDAAVPLF